MSKRISEKKYISLEKVSNNRGLISALAIDQRGALKRMFSQYSEVVEPTKIVDFKKIISKELTKYSSSILLDPEYGIEASKLRYKDSGLLLAYEKTGYDANKVGRLPDILDNWSVKRLKDSGADACKFLLYYDVDEPPSINDIKKAMIERIGSECRAEEIPFFLELLSYDANIKDNKSKEFAKIKPHKVIKMMEEFSKDRYDVDVLKVEVPVNMSYVEGYGKDSVYTVEEAKKYFKRQSDSTNLPFIYLSAGVSSQMFQDTLIFAKESGCEFNGVLCGRATWADGVRPFMEKGDLEAVSWMRKKGKQNIIELNDVVERTAVSWKSKLIK